MDTQLMYFSLIVIVVIALAGFGFQQYRRYKTKKVGEKMDPVEILSSCTNLVLEIATTSMEILNAQNHQYKTDAEYKDALAKIVADKLSKELAKTDLASISKLIPEEQYITFVKSIFDMYKTKFSMNSKKEVEEAKDAPKVEAPKKE